MLLSRLFLVPTELSRRGILITFLPSVLQTNSKEKRVAFENVQSDDKDEDFSAAAEIIFKLHRVVAGTLSEKRCSS